MEYNTRNVEGMGLTDGENIERLWSYLDKFVTMTRPMSKSLRHLTLTQALDLYKEERIKNLGTQICSLV